ncbi:MAG: alpha/beta fold hydrolase [Egibacteraceae bacterium]
MHGGLPALEPAGWTKIDRTVGGEAAREVKVGGLRTAHEQAGDRPPLVLLHGGPADSRMWRWQLDGLSDEFTVVTWELLLADPVEVLGREVEASGST